MMTIIDRLKINLGAAGRNNRIMAKFFLIHEEQIRKLIPGSYPSKRHRDFIMFRDQSREINNKPNE